MSYLEEAFEMWLGQNPSIPSAVREYKFHPTRKFRLDFAWPDLKFAVEIEGGLFKGGRHQTMKGFIGDCEKYEAAMILGWVVYRVPGPWIAEGQRMIWREDTMTAIKTMLVERAVAKQDRLRVEAGD